MHVLGISTIDTEAVERTLGAVLKYAEDADTVRQAGLSALVDADA